MIATETTQPRQSRAIPGFSAVKMKEELQERRRRETQGMTPEEVNKYICEGAARFDRYCEEARARLINEQRND